MESVTVCHMTACIMPSDRIALIGIEEEPSTPPQVVPNFAQENAYIYTIASLDITVRIHSLSVL